MQPLIEEVRELWDKCENDILLEHNVIFTMKALCLWTMTNFPSNTIVANIHFRFIMIPIESILQGFAS